MQLTSTSTNNYLQESNKPFNIIGLFHRLITSETAAFLNYMADM